MKNKILWALTLLPTLVTLFAVQFMKNEIPAHYDAMGNINRWGSKYESFILPIIIIIVTVFWVAFLKILMNKSLKTSDEKLINETKQNEKIIYYVAIGMTALFSIIHYCFMYFAIITTNSNIHVMSIDINIITNIGIGVFLIIVGNLIPKSKLNSTVGVRTVWSMKNDVTWAKSNKFGGASLIISGLLIIIESGLIRGIVSTYIMISIIILDGIVSTVYSYIVYKQNISK